METSKFLNIKTGLEGAIERNLGPGGIGVVAARAGIGKTAFLTLIALEEISNGGRVFHVCIDESPEKVKTWYEELLKSHNPGLSFTAVKTLARSVERFRFIVSYLHNSFSLNRLEEALKGVVEHAGFRPTLVVIDGLDVEQCEKNFFPGMRNVLKKYGIPAWLSMRINRYPDEISLEQLPYPCNLVEKDCNAILLMEPKEEGKIGLCLVKEGDSPSYQARLISNFRVNVFTPCS